MPRRPFAHKTIKAHLLGRALVLLGVAIATGSIAALAFGAKRIVAENAAYKGPSAPLCVPSQLNRSDLLPGTQLAVSPLPDSLDASDDTQISLLGYPASALSEVSVNGSRSGNHSGGLEAYSQGDGASFVPAKGFDAGELVTVRGKLSSAGKRYPFQFHFTTSVPDPLGHPASSPNPTAKAGELYVFHSRPELKVPVMTVTASAAGQQPGDIFAAPYSGAGQDGPTIYDGAGNLVWFDPLPPGTESANLQVQTYEGKPVLTWWQGYIPPQGFGQGEEVIANTNYQVIRKFPAGNGLPADLHEFRITPRTRRCYLLRPDPLQPLKRRRPKQRRRDRQPLPGNRPEDTPRPARVASAGPRRPLTVLREPDRLHDGMAVRLLPHQLDRPNPDGSTLISSRNTSALYELNTSTGQISAQIGGKHPTLTLGTGAATAYQHDAQELPNGEVSVFDNGGVPKVHPQSRGVILALNPTAKTDTLVGEYEHPTPIAAGSQGSVQALEGGNMFIGWGAEPYFSEYTAGGTLVFDAHMPKGAESYRAYRFQWTGYPTGAPSIAAATGSGGTTTVYASWDGATQIASWQVLAGASPTKLTVAAGAPKSGFETSISTPGKPAYVAVQALSAEGALLGTSRAIKG